MAFFPLLTVSRPRETRTIKNSFHDCILTKVDSSTNKWCASCHKHIAQKPCYGCLNCNFYMDDFCTLMRPRSYDESQPHIGHFSHQCLMLLCEIFHNEEAICFACQSQCFGTPTYACNRCEYFLHKRCAECQFQVTQYHSHENHNLSLYIDHEKIIPCKSCVRSNCCFLFHCQICNWFICIDCYLLPKQLHDHDYNYLIHSRHDHAQHNLITLSFSSAKFMCSICHISFASNSPRFECAALCGFVVDVECALTPSVTRDSQGYYRHYSHPHAMTLLEMNDEDKNCSACYSPCTSCLAYSCTECKSFLHKACAELPLKLHYPNHKHPSLTLIPCKELRSRSFLCSLCCRKFVYGILFQCSNDLCTFQLCTSCISRPTVKYELMHEHSLCLVENVHKNLECSAYDGYCKLAATSLELCITENSMLRCVDCDFSVHLLCGPLPCTIQYEYHMHPLVLVNSVLDDNSGEYCCDICESERHPRIYVYSCEECKYIAHVHCLISQIITILRKDDGHGKLKTMKINDPEEIKNKLEFRDIVNKLSEEEINMLWRNFSFDCDIQHHQKLAHFTPQYFENFVDFLNRLHLSKRLEIKSDDLKSEVAVVEGYTIPRTLARVLTLLLRKHKDISSRSEATPAMKSVTFHFICQVLHSMATTRVTTITKDGLEEWYCCLHYALRRGFDVDFIFDHLKDVVRAFIGLQAVAEINVRRDIETITADDILQLQNKLNNMESKSYSSFGNWRNFTVECLSKALEFMDKDHVAGSLL